jgi:tetratricopeptide (TPR) repeat protein
MPTEPGRHGGTNGCILSAQADKVDGLGEDLLDAALTEQRRDWVKGDRTSVTERLRRFPALALDAAQAADLVYHEFILREELGECPDLEEYLGQFPEYANVLLLLRQADQIVEQALAPTEQARHPAAQLGDYDMLEEIGHGGMGVVFRARQRSLDRIVAVKLMRTGDAGEEERKRFTREAQAVARLQHPNIVQIYEVGEAGGQPFFSLEFVEGESLARRLNGTPLAARQAAALVEVLARAIHYAHGKGIIHRDLKPSNVLLAGTRETALEQCTAKVTDFGLAKRLDSGGDTVSGSVLGTPSYMAPEQAEARTAAIDRRTDVYGLGAILYEMLSGRPPFRAESPLHTLVQVVQADPARPRLVNPAVPRDLETVCLQCLHKEPRRRYPTALALAEDLNRFLHGRPVRARPVGPVGRTTRWCRRKPVIAALGAMLILAVAGGLLMSFLLWRRSAGSEAKALVNLHAEEVARHEADEALRMILQMVADNMRVSDTPSVESTNANSMQINMLLNAEACCSHLLEKRGQDQKLQVMSSTLLRWLGERYSKDGSKFESLLMFEKATRVLEPSAPVGARGREYLAEAVSAHAHLGSAYELQGRMEPARQAYATSLSFWQELAQAFPCPDRRCDAVTSGLSFAQVLQAAGYSGENIQVMFERRPGASGLLGGGQQFELFLSLLRVMPACYRAQRSGQQAAMLAAGREASAILDRYYQRSSLNRAGRFWLAIYSTQIGLVLRKGGAAAEALHLLSRANRTLQELAGETPNDYDLFSIFGDSWVSIGNAHWELGQVEETLGAFRHSLAAQRQASALAPAGMDSDRELGQLHLKLGRKLCELGRLDEAESCFKERQNLWPGDGNKHIEALREVRKWADQIGSKGTDLSPARRQERQRYLAFAARLEQTGVAAASAPHDSFGR